jgi:hypothetical protein
MTNVTEAVGFEAMSTLSSFAFRRPILLLAFIPFALFFILYVKKGGLTRKKTSFILVRLLVLALAVCALSEPIMLAGEEEIGEPPSVTVLYDASPSMRLYRDVPATGYAIYESLRAEFQNLTGNSSNVRVDSFSGENNTAIGDALYSTIIQYHGPSYTVLLTDGVNNAGRNPVDVARIMAKANSTIYTVAPQKQRDDVYIIDVLGDKKVPSNIRYESVVLIGYTGSQTAEYELKISVNGNERYSKIYRQSEKVLEVPFDFIIRDIGLHEVVVTIERENDVFHENNIFYKPIEVVAKPKILVVSANRTSPMLEILQRLYDVEVSSRVDADYTRYSGVIFDNIHADQFPREQVNKIRRYIMDGNGVAFVGGKNSFE